MYKTCTARRHQGQTRSLLLQAGSHLSKWNAAHARSELGQAQITWLAVVVTLNAGHVTLPALILQIASQWSRVVDLTSRSAAFAAKRASIRQLLLETEPGHSCAAFRVSASPVSSLSLTAASSDGCTSLSGQSIPPGPTPGSNDC